MSDVNSFPELDHQIKVGPTYQYEYSTREAYGENIRGWGSNDPLNATWWHLVTEGMSSLFVRRLRPHFGSTYAEMERDHSLVQVRSASYQS